MSGKITPELIREHGAQLRRITLDEKRAAELAEEVARLNDTVINAADRLLDFNDDPGRFAALLAAASEPLHTSSRRRPGSRNTLIALDPGFRRGDGRSHKRTFPRKTARGRK